MYLIPDIMFGAGDRVISKASLCPLGDPSSPTLTGHHKAVVSDSGAES